MQYVFGFLAAIGFGYAVNWMFDDTYDARTTLLGRLGALAFSTGAIGLAFLALQSC